MKLIITGAGGMLATDLELCLCGSGHDVTALTEKDVDVTDLRSVADMPAGADVLINCAAYTDVDGAESSVSSAYRVNADGAANLAGWCLKNQVRMLHVSTDYVFDGTKRIPYTEDDPVNPVNVYGKSKLQGERSVQGSGCSYMIIRTQSLFGHSGRNFVRTIIDLMAKGVKPLKVVSDQESCPTYTRHLSAAILNLLNSDEQGIVNVSSSGSCSWFDFARAIAGHVRPDYGVMPVKSVEFPRPAVRPAFSVLDKSKYHRITGCTMPGWNSGLEEYLKEVF